MVRIKCVYHAPSGDDGVRILVDRVCPRGLSKQRANINEWRKDLPPSAALRKWFNHDPLKWQEFRRRYRAELTRSGAMELLKDLARRTRTVALKEYLEELA